METAVLRAHVASLPGVERVFDVGRHPKAGYTVVLDVTEGSARVLPEHLVSSAKGRRSSETGTVRGRVARMNRLSRHFTSMAYNNAWANHRLLSAVARLSPEDFVAVRVSFFPTLRATLSHNLTVDWYYVDALERSLAGAAVNAAARAFFEPREPHATCATLHVAQRAVDARLLTLCRGLTDERLDGPVAILRSTGVVHETVTRTLAHLFQHQIHHRGQVHAMLAGTSVAPPQLDDFFCAGDAPARAKEMRELGFDEAEIWA